MENITWTSPDPKQRGTTRTATVGGTVFGEYFLIYDKENKRFAFRFDSISRPLLSAGVEDYIVESLPGGRSKFTYSVYIAPSCLSSLLCCCIKSNLENSFRGATVGFGEYIVKKSNVGYVQPDVR
jgi:hypothetical protein